MQIVGRNHNTEVRGSRPRVKWLDSELGVEREWLDLKSGKDLPIFLKGL